MGNNIWVKIIGRKIILHKIRDYLLNEFNKIAELQAKEGLPMPADPFYVECVQVMERILPSVYPEFPLELIKYFEDRDIHKLLIERAKSTIGSVDFDWMHFRYIFISPNYFYTEIIFISYYYYYLFG